MEPLQAEARPSMEMIAVSVLKRLFVSLSKLRQCWHFWRLKELFWLTKPVGRTVCPRTKMVSGYVSWTWIGTYIPKLFYRKNMQWLYSTPNRRRRSGCVRIRQGLCKTISRNGFLGWRGQQSAVLIQLGLLSHIRWRIALTCVIHITCL